MDSILDRNAFANEKNCSFCTKTIPTLRREISLLKFSKNIRIFHCKNEYIFFA